MATGAAKVTFTVKDISERAAGISLSSAAIVFGSNKGSLVPELITSTTQFQEEYGDPATTDLAMHCALGYLQEGNQLYACRVVDGALHGGVSITSGTPVSYATVTGVADILGTLSFEADTLFICFAKDPGTWNNDLGIKISDVDPYYHYFTVTVQDEDENGVLQTVETFTECSRDKIVDGYGNSMYIEDRINGASKYIYVRNNTDIVGTTDPAAVATAVQPAAGTNGSTISAAELIVGWNLFTDTEAYDLRILINGGYTDSSVQTKIKTVAEARLDCVAILDVPLASTDAADAVTFRTTTQNYNTSYCALETPWLKIYDEFNGAVISIPKSGDVAAMYALTDRQYGFAGGAPAGLNRGVFPRAVGLRFNTLTKTTYTAGELDTMADNQLNPIKNDKGYGIVQWGESTLLSRQSALRDVHIRRLINQIGIQATELCKTYLFEPLLISTYYRVQTTVDQYMRDLDGLGAFDNGTPDAPTVGYRVVVDSTNNTPSDRDNDILNVWLYVKPVKVAKYVQIKCVITRSSASFDAVIAAGI